MAWYAPLITAATAGLYDIIKGAIEGDPEPEPRAPGQSSNIMQGPMQAAPQIAPTQMQIPGAPPPRPAYGQMPNMGRAQQEAMKRYMGG